MRARSWQEVRADRPELPPKVAGKPLIFGKFIQVSDDAGIVVCGPDDLPPANLAEPIQPEGWALLDGVLDLNLGEDGWAELYVYVREGT